MWSAPVSTPTGVTGGEPRSQTRRRIRMKIWVEIAIKNKPDTFIQLEYETYRILPDGSVSNWLRNRVRNERMENSRDWSYARHYPIGVRVICLRLACLSPRPWRRCTPIARIAQSPSQTARNAFRIRLSGGTFLIHNRVIKVKTIKCPECGGEILIIPDSHEMSNAIENHINQKHPIRAGTEIQDRAIRVQLRLRLAQLVLEGI